MIDDNAPQNPLTQDFDGLTANLRAHQANPEGFAEHMTQATGDLGTHIPNVVQGLHSTAARALAFLSQKLPRPGQALPLSNPDWKPNRADREKFKSYFQAVNDPVSVLDEVRDGTLTSHHMEALATVHPDLLADMRNALVGHVDPDKDHDMPYGRKIALAKFMGMPLDSQMTPSAIVSAQMAVKAQPTPQQGQAQGAVTRKATLGKSGIATRSQSEARADEETPD